MRCASSIFAADLAVLSLLGVLFGASLGGCTRSPARSVESKAPSDDGEQTQPPAVVSELDGVGPDMQEAAVDRPAQTIYRSELSRALLRGPGYLLYQLGPEPFRASGKFIGWQITHVFPDDPQLCAPGCDLFPGDIILGINGDSLETPQAFSKFIEKLPSTRTLRVSSLRNERRRVVTYTIVDD